MFTRKNIARAPENDQLQPILDEIKREQVRKEESIKAQAGYMEKYKRSLRDAMDVVRKLDKLSEELVTESNKDRSIELISGSRGLLQDRETLLLFFQHMSEKVAARLRKHELKAKTFFIGFNTNNGWVKGRSRTEIAMDDGLQLYRLCESFLNQHWQGNSVFQVQVTALDPLPDGSQLDLFTRFDERKDRLNRVMDQVNQRYGEFALSPMRLVNRSEMPNVISPAWKPGGHRQTILPQAELSAIKEQSAINRNINNKQR